MDVNTLCVPPSSSPLTPSLRFLRCARSRGAAAPPAPRRGDDLSVSEAAPCLRAAAAPYGRFAAGVAVSACRVRFIRSPDLRAPAAPPAVPLSVTTPRRAAHQRAQCESLITASGFTCAHAPARAALALSPRVRSQAPGHDDCRAASFAQRRRRSYRARSASHASAYRARSRDARAAARRCCSASLGRDSRGCGCQHRAHICTKHFTSHFQLRCHFTTPAVLR